VKKIIVFSLFLFLIGLHFIGKPLNIVKAKVKPILQNYQFLSFKVIVRTDTPSIPIKKEEVRYEIYVIAPPNDNNEKLINSE
jgi:CHASE1-domain containing sensor protein